MNARDILECRSRRLHVAPHSVSSSTWLYVFTDGSWGDVVVGHNSIERRIVTLPSSGSCTLSALDSGCGADVTSTKLKNVMSFSQPSWNKARLFRGSLIHLVYCFKTLKILRWLIIEKACVRMWPCDFAPITSLLIVFHYYCVIYGRNVRSLLQEYVWTGLLAHVFQSWSSTLAKLLRY